MRTLPVLAVALAMFAGPAYAQLETGKQKSGVELQDEREQRNRQEIDKEYEATMRRTRSSAPATSSDPWRGIRPTDSKPKR
jgi:hypothetical protein